MRFKKSMKYIHDNIWGDIPMSDMAIRCIDTNEFQRLHLIRQTGMAYRVFPTAIVSRFAHSIGTYHTTRLLLENIQTQQPGIDLTEQEKEWIMLAALLHDIGHGPFSHAFDVYLKTLNTPWSIHENRSVDLVAYMVNKYKWDDVDAEFIQSLIDPIGHSSSKTADRWFVHLINNPIHGIDTDKMDYLVRDNHQFGLSMTIDMKRIIHNTRVIDGTICFCNKVQDELWNLFLIRHRLHATVYRHPRILKFESELNHILSEMEEEEMFRFCIFHKDVQAFLKWTDAYILVRADPRLIREFNTRTSSNHHSDKDFRPYIDHQFPKLTRVFFYDRKDLFKKFHIQLPSPHCPFSLPISAYHHHPCITL